MKINRKDCTIEFKNGIFISYWQCLTEIFKMRKFNWSTFQFLNVEFENDRACQHYSLSLVILCCGIRINIPFTPEEEHEVHKEINDVLSGLKNSCYGWTDNESYEAFRKKKEVHLTLWAKKSLGGKRKVFLQ